MDIGETYIASKDADFIAKLMTPDLDFILRESGIMAINSMILRRQENPLEWPMDEKTGAQITVYEEKIPVYNLDFNYDMTYLYKRDVGFESITCNVDIAPPVLRYKLGEQKSGDIHDDIRI